MNSSTASSATTVAKCQAECDKTQNCSGFSLTYGTSPPTCQLYQECDNLQTTQQAGTVSYLKVPQCLPYYPCNDEYPYLVNTAKGWQCQQSKTSSSGVAPPGADKGSCFYARAQEGGAAPQYCTECLGEAQCYTYDNVTDQQVSPLQSDIYKAYPGAVPGGCALRSLTLENRIPPNCQNLNAASYVENACQNHIADCSKHAGCARDVNANSCNTVCDKDAQGQHAWDCNNLYTCVSLCDDLDQAQCTGSVCSRHTQEDQCNDIPTCAWQGGACTAKGAGACAWDTATQACAASPSTDVDSVWAVEQTLNNLRASCGSDPNTKSTLTYNHAWRCPKPQYSPDIDQACQDACRADPSCRAASVRGDRCTLTGAYIPGAIPPSGACLRDPPVSGALALPPPFPDAQSTTYVQGNHFTSMQQAQVACNATASCTGVARMDGTDDTYVLMQRAPAQLAKDDCFERLLGKDVRCPGGSGSGSSAGPVDATLEGCQALCAGGKACLQTNPCPQDTHPTSWGSRRPGEVAQWSRFSGTAPAARWTRTRRPPAAPPAARPVRAARRRRPRVRRRGRGAGVAGVGGRDGRERQAPPAGSSWARPRAPPPPLWAHARRRASGTRSAPPCSSARTRRRTGRSACSRATRAPPTRRRPPILHRNTSWRACPAPGARPWRRAPRRSPPPWPTQAR